MLVVSNTSPISNLAIVGHLDLLRLRYGHISIPECVRQELARLTHPSAVLAIERVIMDGWLQVEKLADPGAVLSYERRVDPGEAAAIALAEQLGADKLIVDDRLGRELARERKLSVAGMLGELLHAKDQGRILSVRSVMDALRAEARFFVRDDLQTLILRQAGE